MPEHLQGCPRSVGCPDGPCVCGLDEATYTVADELAWWKAHSYHPCDAVPNDEVTKLVEAERARIERIIEAILPSIGNGKDAKAALLAAIREADDASS